MEQGWEFLFFVGPVEVVDCLSGVFGCCNCSIVGVGMGILSSELEKISDASSVLATIPENGKFSSSNFAWRVM
ncbi:hypothetical protein HanIR_Chr02g0060401 [Helianthus annuus]|nr:hypothetical protein HanIR_Chr02g0060401 [Helianthus annuus]